MEEGEVIKFGNRKLKMLEGKYRYILFNAHVKSSDEKFIPTAKRLCDFINDNSIYITAFDFRRMKEVQAINTCDMGERIRTDWVGPNDEPIYLRELWITSSDFLDNEMGYYERGEKHFLDRAWDATYKACIDKYKIFLSGGILLKG